MSYKLRLIEMPETEEDFILITKRQKDLIDKGELVIHCGCIMTKAAYEKLPKPLVFQL